MVKQIGFTLIELMVTIAIMAILLTLAMPSFRDMIAANRIATQSNLLLTDLVFARSEAVKRGLRVTLCPSTNQTSCTNTAWKNGWIVFVDTSNFGVVDATEEVLRANQGLSGDTTVTLTGFSSSYVQYLSSGSLASGSGAGVADLNGVFTVCISGYTGRAISINMTGRASSAATASTCS